MSFNSASTAARLGLLLLLALAVAGCANTRRIDAGPPSPNGAELFLPYQFQIQAIDGTVLRERFYTFDGRDQTLRVAPGEHELTLRYYDMIEDDRDRTGDYVKVLSEPITLRFVAEADGSYAVVGPRPDTPSAGEAYALEPTLAVENRTTGETVSSDVRVAEPEVDTIRRGNTVYEAVRHAASGAAAATGASAETATTARTGAPRAAPADGSPRSVEMLKYWWNNASAEERARFNEWRAAD